MRVLLITHEFAPQSNPRAVRWTAIAREWARRGHAVDVVCGVPADADADPVGARVHRVGLGWTSWLRHRFGRARAEAAEPDRATFRSVLRRGTVRALRTAHAVCWKPLLWPDYAARWARPAFHEASRLLNEHRHDAVVTVSNPYTGHLVGTWLKRRHPDCRWIADIGDPFSIDDRFRCNNAWVFARANRRLEHAVLHAADRVTVVTETMARKYRSAFPAAADRVVTVQPLLAPSSERGPLPPLNRAARRLSYFGTLYRGLRSPEPLLALFRELSRLPEPGSGPLELHVFGNVNDCGGSFQRGGEGDADPRIVLYGVVSRDRVQREIADSDVLVNVGNAVPYGLPSKVVEYVATGRPILNVAHARDDTSAEFLARYPAAVTVFADELEGNARRDTVARVAKLLRNPPRPSASTVDRLLAPHRVESVADSYEELLRAEPSPFRRAA